MKDLIEAIEDIFSSARGNITFEDKALPFPEEMDNSALVRLIGNPLKTRLHDGIEKTARIFHEAIRRGIV